MQRRSHRGHRNTISRPYPQLDLVQLHTLSHGGLVVGIVMPGIHQDKDPTGAVHDERDRLLQPFTLHLHGFAQVRLEGAPRAVRACLAAIPLRGSSKLAAVALASPDWGSC